MKRNYWPIFFIGLFSFSFAMIVWTIYSATQTPVHEDETFFMSYRDLKENFNDVVASNEKFLEKYDFEIIINKKKFPLIINDMFLSQRVLEEKSKHKDIFLNGKNNISLVVLDKKTKNLIKDIDISFRISRPTNHNNTMDFMSKDFKEDKNKYNLTVDLPLEGNWNVTARFKIKQNIGYFYIKSNAI